MNYKIEKEESRHLFPAPIGIKQTKRNDTVRRGGNLKKDENV
jgi:hypothetical protein